MCTRKECGGPDQQVAWRDKGGMDLCFASHAFGMSDDDGGVTRSAQRSVCRGCERPPGGSEKMVEEERRQLPEVSRWEGSEHEGAGEVRVPEYGSFVHTTRSGIQPSSIASLALNGWASLGWALGPLCSFLAT